MKKILVVDNYPVILKLMILVNARRRRRLLKKLTAQRANSLPT
jgi:hypothetical protein